MAKGSTTDHDILLYVLNKTAPSWASNSNYYIALHSADPTATGNQTSHEVSYGGYARVAVAVSSAGFTVTSATGANAATITFPTCTSGTDTATHVSIGTASSGSGQILYFGPLAASLAISATVQPAFDPGTLLTTEA